jgi:hypothetical protein
MDALTDIIQIRDRDDSLTAGQRANGGVINVGARGEIRGKSPCLSLSHRADRTRIIALDPAVIAPVAHIQPRQAHRPGSRRDTGNRGLHEGRKIDADIIGAVGRMIEFIVNTENRAGGETPVFDELTKRSLLARIIKLYPELESVITGEQKEAKSESLIVSWSSLDKRKEEFEELINKKIPFDFTEADLLDIVSQFGSASGLNETQQFGYGQDVVPDPTRFRVLGGHQEGFINSHLLSPIDGLDTFGLDGFVTKDVRASGIQVVFSPAWLNLTIGFYDSDGFYRTYLPREKELQLALAGIEQWSYYKKYQSVSPNNDPPGYGFPPDDGSIARKPAFRNLR